MSMSLFFSDKCNSQHDKINRKAVVAGRFYSGNHKELKDDLDRLFKAAQPKQSENVKALIAPHAGYVFSGEVAASSYNQLNNKYDYDNIFIIGTSHQTMLKGASIYNLGDYETPFGTAEVNTDIANKLLENSNLFEYNETAHKYEHSLEVQIPFLQHHLKSDYKIIPIIIGTDKTSVIKEIADKLKPYFLSNNLFVISTDFSHYPEYEQAKIADKNIAEAIVSNKSDLFLHAIENNKKANISGLATSICGWSSVLSLMYITESLNNYNYKIIDYMNSGDSPYGEKDRVVGYYSIVLEHNKKQSDMKLTDEEKNQLLTLAQNTIHKYIKEGRIYEPDKPDNESVLNEKCGAFVTLNKNGKLRGCIGRFEGEQELYLVVRDMAIASATQDNRFQKVKEKELTDLHIEISVLTPLKKIESKDEIEIGKHGIYIKSGHNHGTLLPQVAVNMNWDVDDFLGHCSKNKAGIGWDGWKTADVYIYEAIVFEQE